jgi:hypothetical protein
MTRDEAAAIGALITNETRTAAQAYSGQLLGKVVSRVNGFVTVELPSGQQVRHIASESRVRWQVDNMVSISVTEGKYSVTGPGGAEGP